MSIKIAADISFFITADEPQKFVIGKTTIAVYRPYSEDRLTYRVTEKNKEFVQDLIDQSKAQIGTPRRVDDTGLNLKVAGRVSTTKKKA